MRQAAVLAAIDHLLEANAALRKRRSLATPERELEAAMATAFAAQRRAFLSRLVVLKGRFPPAVREVAEVVQWEPLFDEAALETIRVFQGPLDEVTARALASGMLAAVADLSVETSFTLEHPAAVDYLRQRGADSVIGITQTTRNELRTILTQAADEGWSYNRTAKAITERYQRFAGRPARRYRHIRTRAHAVAVFEVGNAYEHGNMLVARDLADAGLSMQKQWLSVGDRRVRPAHRANQAQGWIPLGDAFQDGSKRPPTDSGCRCTLLMRRKPDA